MSVVPAHAKADIAVQQLRQSVQRVAALPCTDAAYIAGQQTVLLTLLEQALRLP